MKEIRLLTPREIECRVQQVKAKSGDNAGGVSLLLYKDARCDMAILDEVFGAANWQRKHELIDGKLYCSVGIKYGDEWVWKQDVGTESNTEKEKGQASDSFKRACFNVGIGRELYTAPFIWINGNHVNIGEYKGKATCNDRFNVVTVKYNAHREITGLTIENAKTHKIVYTFGDVDDKVSTPVRVEKVDSIPVPKTITCARCGFEIRESSGKDGKKYTPHQVAEIARKQFGAEYCCSCMQELKKAREQAENGNGGT